ncbi:MAG: hypothetical protein JWN38_572 [Candidatus Saccharibacteria bacterium]|nr:hypothetical protein [Candidatus Saccharibacteria bacterium]
MKLTRKPLSQTRPWVVIVGLIILTPLVLLGLLIGAFGLVELSAQAHERVLKRNSLLALNKLPVPATCHEVSRDYQAGMPDTQSWWDVQYACDTTFMAARQNLQQSLTARGYEHVDPYVSKSDTLDTEVTYAGPVGAHYFLGEAAYEGDQRPAQPDTPVTVIYLEAFAD